MKMIKGMKIRELMREDLPQLEEFYREVIGDTVQREEITIPDFVEDEVRWKMDLSRESLGEGAEVILLTAMEGSVIVGTISAARCSTDIRSVLAEVGEDAIEVGSVYVHPSCQRGGIGGLLVDTMVQRLRSGGIDEFYLDSGYRSAQVYWRKRYGEPYYIAKDYWAPEADNMIWRIDLKPANKML